MGLEAMVIRFAGPDWMREEWIKEKAFEFLWEPSDNFDTKILCHVIKKNYGDMMNHFDFDNILNRIMVKIAFKKKVK